MSLGLFQLQIFETGKSLAKNEEKKTKELILCKYRSKPIFQNLLRLFEII